MALVQAATITLQKSGAVAAVTTYYFKATSGTPTLNKSKKEPGAGWYETEPKYEANTKLYVATRTDLVDGTFLWSDVSLSSAYTAAGAASDKADKAQATADGTRQWFYVDDKGAHVVYDLDSAGHAQGYHLLLNGDGLVVMDAKTLRDIARFGAGGAAIGIVPPGGEDSELVEGVDYASAQVLPGAFVATTSDGETYLSASDGGLSVVTEDGMDAVATVGMVEGVQVNVDANASAIEAAGAEIDALQAYGATVSAWSGTDASGNLRLGKGSARLRFGTDGMAVEQGGQDVAGVRGGTVTVPQAEVTESLSMGGFRWVPRSNGHLSLMYLEGNGA